MTRKLLALSFSICVLGIIGLAEPVQAGQQSEIDSCYFCMSGVIVCDEEAIDTECKARGCPTGLPGCSGGPTPSCPDGVMYGCNS